MDNLISRQKVLNTLDNMDKALDEERTVEKYKELLTECIKVLPSAENKGDLISRQAVMECFKKWRPYMATRLCEFENELTAIPSVENKGTWTEWKGRNGRYKGIPICSNCNTGFPIFAKDYKFCPNCGSDMRGEA